MAHVPSSQFRIMNIRDHQDILRLFFNIWWFSVNSLVYFKITTGPGEAPKMAKLWHLVNWVPFCSFMGDMSMVRILKWRYVSTICLAIFCSDIPLHRPEI